MNLSRNTCHYLRIHFTDDRVVLHKRDPFVRHFLERVFYYVKIFKNLFILVLLTGCGTVTKGNNIVKTKTESTEQQWANEVTATIDAAGNVTVISENSQTDSATDAGDEHNKGTNSSALDSNQTSNDGANTDAGNKDNSPNNKPADNDNQMINVSISIDCKTILNNMNDLKDGYCFFRFWALCKRDWSN